MPVHDWGCPTPDCTERVLDRYEPRVAQDPPLCPAHNLPMARLWTTNSARSTFEGFEVEGFDGKPHHIGSMGDLRKFEAESIRRGQPQLFRNFSQDHSNRDVHLIGKREFPKFQTHSKRGIPYVTPGPKITVDARDLE